MDHSKRAPTETDKLVGENIRRIRIRRKETLTETGGALGITHQQLQKYEVGTNRISAGMLKLVADHFGLSIADLFDGADTAVKPAPVPPAIMAQVRAAHSALGRIVAEAAA